LRSARTVSRAITLPPIAAWLIGAGDGARLMMLILHDDVQREYAYGPAQGLPETKVGAFSQALYEEAKKWTAN
jgi:hypothetical protein